MGLFQLLTERDALLDDPLLVSFANGQPIPLGSASVKLVPAAKDAPPAARLVAEGGFTEPTKETETTPAADATATAMRAGPASVPPESAAGSRSIQSPITPPSPTGSGQALLRFLGQTEKLFFQCYD